MGQAMQSRERLEERNLPLEPTETEMEMKKRLSELDGLIEQITGNLNALQSIRDRLAAQIADPPDQNGYPVTDHQRIMRIVPFVTNISWERIKSTDKNRRVVNARWLAINMLSECGGTYSSGQIGRFLDKDHTTVLYARKGWPKLYTSNENFQQIAQAAWYQFYRERI